MTETVNLQEASSLLGKSVNTLKSWFRSGCPVVKQGSQKVEWQIRIADVVQWREELAAKKAVGDTSLATTEELRERKLAADTALAEIEAAKAKGEVVYIDDAVSIITNDTLATKARLRNIPSRVVPQIIGETDENRLNEIITNEIDYALEELSNRFIDIDKDVSEPSEQEA